MAISIEYFSRVETVAVPPHSERIPVSDSDIEFIEEWLKDSPTRPEFLTTEDLRKIKVAELKEKTP
jgi:hypothetical protein